MSKKPGRLGHGYEIRVERVGQLASEGHQVWGIEEDLPEEWDTFTQEHVGDPDIHAAQIYRSSERRKGMEHRNIRDTYTPRDPTIPSWRGRND